LNTFFKVQWQIPFSTYNDSNHPNKMDSNPAPDSAQSSPEVDEDDEEGQETVQTPVSTTRKKLMTPFRCQSYKTFYVPDVPPK